MSKVSKIVRTALVGPNIYEVDRALLRLKTAFAAQYGDLAIEQIDGEEVSSQVVMDKAQAVSLLSPKKLLIIKRLSGNKDSQDIAEKLIEALDQSTDLIIVEPNIDKRSSYYKFIKKNYNLEEFRQLDNISLITWVIKEVKDLGGDISRIDAAYLVERAGENQQKLSKEIIKLVLYKKSVSKESIELLVNEVASGTIFQLLDASFSDDKNSAINIYKNLREQRVEPQHIFGMLFWQMHIVAIIAAKGEKTLEMVHRDTKINPFVLQKSQRIVEKLSYDKIQNILNQLCQLDYELKTESINADEALMQLIIEIG